MRKAKVSERNLLRQPFIANIYYFSVEIIDAIALTIRKEVEIWWFVQPQMLARYGFFGSAFGGLG